MTIPFEAILNLCTRSITPIKWHAENNLAYNTPNPQKSGAKDKPKKKSAKGRAYNKAETIVGVVSTILDHGWVEGVVGSTFNFQPCKKGG